METRIFYFSTLKFEIGLMPQKATDIKDLKEKVLKTQHKLRTLYHKHQGTEIK